MHKVLKHFIKDKYSKSKIRSGPWYICPECQGDDPNCPKCKGSGVIRRSGE